MDIEVLRKSIRQDKFIIKTHAKQRMGLRGITLDEALKVILKGEIIETIPKPDLFPNVL
ncbi:MAG: DUF4258 domain-containing protein [Actinobacteria bacterium]|nr:DUF4258 domain-containing protein [Actinomycetota bacterium]